MTVSSLSFFPVPENSWVGDPIPFYNKGSGSFYIYYLDDFRDDAQEFHPWALFTTKDFLHFSDQGADGMVHYCIAENRTGRSESPKQINLMGTGFMQVGWNPTEYICIYSAGMQPKKIMTICRDMRGETIWSFISWNRLRMELFSPFRHLIPKRLFRAERCLFR
jgi:hypothetical protein